MSEQKKEWKVGDELAICHGRRYRIYEITKISKTGRITLGNDAYVLNPDLRVRGLENWSHIHSSAYPVTDEIRQETARAKKIQTVISLFRDVMPVHGFTDEELDQIIAIKGAAKQREEAKHAHRHQAD